ncbi:hypothetical protein TPHA_0E02780 [Tetrapisispora phaffii CBS 4417]|uniref:Small ribosomal subunit protein mS29 n=1 Tax=Tetrapisispora phaffii (strain ATCC 24235 / CBS 4417 / NBRC 1672 / NRRL Y-8282 / UCD 70-5) TaxID=1071381 RepID=G8BTZ0_TETPH|nr:mitochondrial 37S ribosomal protein RSM23 TPHA_0E02780 [Tetrapisispora phaffii CBS 4417]CCE63368.1 hypothetical protein TPHA_0E02780 [Tetrapisispora phaffii CBS 4417]
MLRVQLRQFSRASILEATSPVKGRAQGFAKKQSGGKTSKKNTSGSYVKKWIDTVSTSGFNKFAKPVDMPVFEATKNLEAALNNVSKYHDSQYKSLYHMGSFKKNQFNELFFRPISLVREKSTQKFIDLMNTSSNKKFIITGEPGIGKSVLLAQIHAYASDSKHIVINISHPDLLVNGRNDFFYDKNLKLYIQPMYLKKFLRKILKSNDETTMKSIKLASDYKFTNADPKDNLVRKFVTLTKDTNSFYDLLTTKTTPAQRGEQFKAIITELSNQKTTPVLVSVDNFSRLLTTSLCDYKNESNERIETLEFQIAKFVMDSISGEIKYKNPESAVVLATSGEDRTNKTLPVALNKIPEDIYLKRYHYDPVYANILKQGKVKEFEVPKLGKDEVQKLIEFYLKANIMPRYAVGTKPLEQLINEKFIISGNGNPRELLKSIVLSYF